MPLYPHQVLAVEAAQAAIEAGEDPLIVMPTGTGKTTVFAELIQREHAKHAQPVVIAAHRKELVEQAAARIGLWCGKPAAIEMAELRADPRSDWCISASVDSIVGRLDRYPVGSVGLLVIDEAHHAGSESYRKLARHFGCPVVGLTATPGRQDSKKLGFSVLAYQYKVLDAIRDRMLVPVSAISLDLEINHAALAKTRAGEDFSEDAAAAAISDSLGAYCSGFAKVIGSRPAVVFMPSVKQVYEAADLLRGLGLRVGAADGTTDKATRAKILDDHGRGEIQVLVNCGLWTEGWDAPYTAAVGIARITKSVSLYMQMMGRGLRNSPGKVDCLVVDATGAGDGLGLADVTMSLSADWDEEVQKIVKEQRRKGVDPIAALEAAIAERERRKLDSALAGATEVKGTRELDIWRAKAKRAPSPIYAADLGINIRARPNDRPPSEKQLALLTRHGFAPPETATEASALIGWLMPRFKAGLCMPRQAKLLLRYGFNPNVTRDEATKIIDAIASNGWRRS